MNTCCVFAFLFKMDVYLQEIFPGPLQRALRKKTFTRAIIHYHVTMSRSCKMWIVWMFSWKTTNGQMKRFQKQPQLLPAEQNRGSAKVNHAGQTQRHPDWLLCVKELQYLGHPSMGSVWSCIMLPTRSEMARFYFRLQRRADTTIIHSTCSHRRQKQEEETAYMHAYMHNLINMRQCLQVTMIIEGLYADEYKNMLEDTHPWVFTYPSRLVMSV